MNETQVSWRGILNGFALTALAILIIYGVGFL